MIQTKIPAPEFASEDWQVAEDGEPRPTTLLVQQRRVGYVLPYFRFIYAEGNNAQVKISFASHLVTVNGHGLSTLLSAIADQCLVRLAEPTENEAKFGVRGLNALKTAGLVITEISVELSK